MGDYFIFELFIKLFKNPPFWNKSGFSNLNKKSNINFLNRNLYFNGILNFTLNI